MRITKRQLKRVIREEKIRILKETSEEELYQAELEAEARQQTSQPHIKHARDLMYQAYQELTKIKGPDGYRIVQVVKPLIDDAVESLHEMLK